MRRRQWVAGWLATMAVLGSSGVMAAGAPVSAGQSTGSYRPDFHAALLERAQKAAATGQPLDLWVASRLVLPLELSAAPNPSALPSRSDAWLDEAIRLGSDQPLIARAAVARCLGGGSCDIPAAVQTLQTRESDEVVAQLLLWQMHTGKRDADAAAHAWTRATQATRYADDVSEGIALLDRATRGGQWPTSASSGDQTMEVDGEAERVASVFALTAAFGIAGLADAYRECPADAVAERREQCRHLFKVMADSGSVFAARLGSSRMRDLSDDAAERRGWDARSRELLWLSERSAQVLEPKSNAARPVSMTDYLQWVGAMGEVPAMRRVLADNGVAAQPPADWKPTRFVN